MPERSPHIKALLARLRELRIESGRSEHDIEEALILGPGWVSRFEDGQTVPQLDLLMSLLHCIDKSLPDLISEIDVSCHPSQFQRNVFAEASGQDLRIQFPYGDYDATYVLPRASVDQFDAVLKTLRDGLARLVNSGENNGEAVKTDSVARAFLQAVELWPAANPSDIWWFVIYRAYCDPFNHPARFARLDLTQSWKRTGGWALEEVLVRHYGPFFRQHGIDIFIASREIKDRLLTTLTVSDRLEADKVDVLLTDVNQRRLFGVVHVKASFAERRTDDVPMSQALVQAGYCSPLWTMDCKSMPSNSPVNRGELGRSCAPPAEDRRSAKRKDIEDDGYFSACFSYNRRTVPTPSSQEARGRVIVCDFSNPDDEFSRFVLDFWHRWSSSR